jgi:hypothetical protein
MSRNELEAMDNDTRLNRRCSDIMLSGHECELTFYGCLLPPRLVRHSKSAQPPPRNGGLDP